MKKLTAVIIGTGSISNTHADAIQKSGCISLCACWNRQEERDMGDAFAEKYGVKYYSSLDEMLDTEKADMTVNCLPYKYHELGLEKAAKQGSHLVVEKPMGISVAACERIIALAEKYKVKLAISESMRFNAVNLTYQSLRQDFGKTIHMIDTNYRDYFSNGRAGWALDPEEGFGGMILNVGVHRVARLRQLAGADEVSVTANAGKMGCDVEGDACIMIRYKNNACGIIMMCGYHKTGKASANLSRIVTEKGHVLLGDDILFTSSDGIEKHYPIDAEFKRGEYEGLYSAFADAVINNKPSPYSGEMGMRDVAVILAAFKSSKEKREITLDE
jgi:predicted dehydrogenase